ncbi:MAG: hypothetical protein L0323_21430, partial [Planctomycetes bacterium]|nr:hypothetical protein [Planctomycetota bacterium]
MTDNAGQTARMTYDSFDRLVLRSDPVGAPIADPLGLYPGPINAPGNTRRSVFDGLGRLTREITDLRVGGEGGGAIDTSNPQNPDGEIRLGYRYDQNSRLEAVIDDAGAETVHAYDAKDRKTGTTYADATAHVFVWDRDDNLVHVTDPNGSIIEKTYDALNRLTRTEVTRASGVEGTTLETFEYDGLSRLTRAEDDNGVAGGGALETSEFVYDSLSRPIEERENGLALTSHFSGDGRRKAAVYPAGRRLDETHDAIDRPTSLLEGSEPLAVFRWAGGGYRPLERVQRNGTRLSFLDDAGTADTGWDAALRPVRLRHVGPAGAIVDREYGYDRAGNRTFERRNDAGGLTDHYRYDSAYRTVETRYDEDGEPGAPPRRDLLAQDYLFDGVGNRREVTV